MSERFSTLREILTARGIPLPSPYPHTVRTLKGSALAALLAGAVLGLGLFAYSSVMLLAGSVLHATYYASEKMRTSPSGTETATEHQEQPALPPPSVASPLPELPTAPVPAPETLPVSVLEPDSHLGLQVRLKMQKSALPYREHGDLSLTDAARQVDFALLQTLLRLNLERGRLIFLTSDYKTRGKDVYHLQRMRLFLRKSAEDFTKALEENLDVWAERGIVTLEAPNKITLAVEGVITHEIWVDTAGDEFLLPPQGNGPRLTIVIDDLGENRKAAQSLLELSIPVTCAIWPFSRFAAETAQAAHKAGREVLIHEPMEPIQSPFIKAGPDALMLSMNRETLVATLKASIPKVPHASGLNNHMGSRLTRNQQASSWVAETLGPSGLFALDSLTTPDSVFYREARKKGLPAYRRAVFLDDGPRTVQSVLKELKRAEQIAHTKGQAIAIGHPHPETIKALQQWAAEREPTIHIVPLRYLSVPVDILED